MECKNCGNRIADITNYDFCSTQCELKYKELHERNNNKKSSLSKKAEETGGLIGLFVICAIFTISVLILKLTQVLNNWQYYKYPFKQVAAFYHICFIKPVIILFHIIISPWKFITNHLTAYQNLNIVLAIIGIIAIVLLLIYFIKISLAIIRLRFKYFWGIFTFIYVSPLAFLIIYVIVKWLFRDKV